MPRKIAIDGQSGRIVADNNAAWDIVNIMTDWDEQTWAWWARHLTDYRQMDKAAAAIKSEKMRLLAAETV